MDVPQSDELEIPEDGDWVAHPPAKHSMIAKDHARSVFWVPGDETDPELKQSASELDKIVLQGCVSLLDQRVLPHGGQQFVFCGTTQEVADGIKDMVVRGAPAIGATGAYGMVVAAAEAVKEQRDMDL